MIRSSLPNRLSFLPALIAGALMLAGCNVGPKYVRPNVTAPPAFRGADGAQVATDAKTSIGDEQWSSIYREPELQELIRKALVNNYDVRIAAQHILEQQAQVKITRSQEFPSITVGGTGIGALTAGQVQNHYNNVGSASYSSIISSTDKAYMYWRMDAPLAWMNPTAVSAYPVAANYGSAAGVNGLYLSGTTPGIAGPAYAGLGSPAYGS